MANLYKNHEWRLPAHSNSLTAHGKTRIGDKIQINLKKFNFSFSHFQNLSKITYILFCLKISLKTERTRFIEGES